MPWTLIVGEILPIEVGPAMQPVHDFVDCGATPAIRVREDWLEKEAQESDQRDRVVRLGEVTPPIRGSNRSRTHPPAS
jgi:hypothetical protein